MVLTTRCPKCQTELNVPQEAAGRRLRCPRPECGHRFYIGGGPASSDPSLSKPKAAKPPSARRGHADLDVPVAEGDLRETFEASFLMGEDDPPPPKSKPATADARALFQDDEPLSRRRPSGAEARARSRRCTCGSVVPAGMSLCGTCGLDLDTGRRDMVDELLDDAPPPISRSSGPPMAIILIGALALMASALLMILSLVKLEGLGAWALALVCLFGVFSSVQFLRGKSARPLLVALMLAGGIDVATLIGLPVYTAISKVETIDDDGNIRPYDERLDTNKITWGIVLLLVDAGAFIYLSTAGVRTHFDAQKFVPGMPPF